MRNASAGTRVRAWLLRTFRGRSAQEAGWREAPATAPSAPETYNVGGLVIDVSPKGPRPSGPGAQSLVFEVRVSRVEDARAWSSRYGFPVHEGSSRSAANAALDELDEIARDADAWRARVTAGMSEEEAEAMEDSPALRLDLNAAEWVGPELEPRRTSRQARGSWV